jgi:hypothetical protein
MQCCTFFFLVTSIADPNPDPDPHVFGPPGSWSISQRYGSGSGSFYHWAKIIRKTLISTVLWLLFDFLSLKNYVNVPSNSYMQKNLVFVGILKVNDENSRIRIPFVGGMDPRIRIHTKMSWIRNTAWYYSVCFFARDECDSHFFTNIALL